MGKEEGEGGERRGRSRWEEEENRWDGRKTNTPCPFHPIDRNRDDAISTIPLASIDFWGIPSFTFTIVIGTGPTLPFV